MANNNTIIGFRRDRLGGRLSNLLSIWRIARKINCRAIIFWPKPISNLEKFYGEDYFARSFLDLCATYSSNTHNDLWIVDDDPGKTLDAPSLTEDPNLIEMNSKGIDQEQFFKESSQIIYNGYKILKLKDEIKSSVDAEISVLLNSLVPSLPIRNAYNRLLSTHNPAEYIAIHYRRGDLGEYLRRATSELGGPSANLARIRRQTDLWFRKCAPLTTYFSYIEKKISKNQKIALFSDEKGIPKQFEDRFGQRRIYRAENISPEMLDIQRVYLEIMFMSRCKSIISTKSGFSELPSIMGGIAITNIQKHCSLNDLAEDYLIETGLMMSKTLPESIIDIFGQSGESHYRRVVKGKWSKDDFQNAMIESWNKINLSV